MGTDSRSRPASGSWMGQGYPMSRPMALVPAPRTTESGWPTTTGSVTTTPASACSSAAAMWREWSAWTTAGWPAWRGRRRRARPRFPSRWRLFSASREPSSEPRYRAGQGGEQAGHYLGAAQLHLRPAHPAPFTSAVPQPGACSWPLSQLSHRAYVRFLASRFTAPAPSSRVITRLGGITPDPRPLISWHWRCSGRGGRLGSRPAG